MRHLPLFLVLALLLASCATLHKETTSTTTSASDTTRVTISDTTRFTIIHESDSITAAHSHRRDSIIIREQIITRYDPSTGIRLDQTISRLTSQVSDLSQYRQIILHQQHIIDSLLTASLALASSHQSDSNYTSDIKEKGDAARSGWQSMLRSGRIIFIFGIFLLLIIMAYRSYFKSKK